MHVEEKGGAIGTTTAVHDRRTYTSCSTGCHRAFTADLDQYVLAGAS